jgi:hypothetical protein
VGFPKHYATDDAQPAIIRVRKFATKAWFTVACVAGSLGFGSSPPPNPESLPRRLGSLTNNLSSNLVGDVVLLTDANE